MCVCVCVCVCVWSACVCEVHCVMCVWVLGALCDVWCVCVCVCVCVCWVCYDVCVCVCVCVCVRCIVCVSYVSVVLKPTGMPALLQPSDPGRKGWLQMNG